MKILPLLLFIPAVVSAQFEHGFKFGAITYADLGMKQYSKDTTASALVLNEFGETYLQSESPNHLVLEYHVKIKVLKQEGLKWADFEIPMRKNGNREESVSNVKASVFNLEDNRIKESVLNSKDIFIEKTNKYWNITKFALPEVHVGSIIEVRYILESPFLFKWRSWEFQSDIPKSSSEFWARIPANYNYNVTLRGGYELSKNESEIIRDCFTPGGNKADCSLIKYAMINIPAFKEEEFMTAKENFLSALNFELMEVKRFDGGTDRISKEWKDVEKELSQEERFGLQIKHARKIWEDRVQVLTLNEKDPLKKTRLIFNNLKNYFLWNEVYGHFTDLGVKKAYQEKKGNIADINLSLVGALQAAGIEAEPALLSTRKNGLPIMIHPVITDFNYVIVQAKIGAEQYWLDATNPLYAFGFVPEKCLNGKVRVMSKPSVWVDLIPKDKDKEHTELSLLINNDGQVEGKLKIAHYGYNAFDQRRKFHGSSSIEEYKKNLAKKWNFEIKSYVCQNADSLENPFIEKFEIVFNENISESVVYFSPFLLDKWLKNPFRSAERNFPVDFGAAREEILMLKLDYKNLYVVEEVPKNEAVALPNAGGRYFFNVSNFNNTIQLTSNLTLNKMVYSPAEYHYLKELFSRVIQIQGSQIILKKNQ